MLTDVSRSQPLHGNLAAAANNSFQLIQAMLQAEGGQVAVGQCTQGELSHS